MESPSLKWTAETGKHGAYRVIDGNGHVVAEGMRKGDAQMVAATPDALAACQTLTAAYADGEKSGGSVEWSDVDHAHRLATAATAKADTPPRLPSNYVDRETRRAEQRADKWGRS